MEFRLFLQMRKTSEFCSELFFGREKPSEFPSELFLDLKNLRIPFQTLFRREKNLGTPFRIIFRREKTSEFRSKSFSEEKKLGKRAIFVSCFVKLNYFAEFHSIPFRSELRKGLFRNIRNHTE